jgi:FkbM family methyltransferase
MDYTYRPAEDVSQHRTQEVLFRYFAAHPPAHTLLVDVGAFGRFMSNSWALLKHGWQGLLIEPNPARRSVIEAEFAGLNFELVCCGIGDAYDRLPFHLHSTSGYDSFSPDWLADDRSDVSIMLDVSPLSPVLMCRGFPRTFGLLSVDAEGFDERIISKFFEDGHFRPDLIVVEAVSFPVASDLFDRNGYSLFAVAGPASTGNLVYSRKL